jgi:hypothetical protein
MSRARDRVAEHAAAVARSREVSSGVLDVLRDYLTRRRNRVLLRFSPAGGDIDVADLVAELLELRYGLLEAHAELLALRAERAPPEHDAPPAAGFVTAMDSLRAELRAFGVRFDSDRLIHVHDPPPTAGGDADGNDDSDH